MHSYEYITQSYYFLGDYIMTTNTVKLDASKNVDTCHSRKTRQWRTWVYR